MHQVQVKGYGGTAPLGANGARARPESRGSLDDLQQRAIPFPHDRTAFRRVVLEALDLFAEGMRRKEEHRILPVRSCFIHELGLMQSRDRKSNGHSPPAHRRILDGRNGGVGIGAGRPRSPQHEPTALEPRGRRRIVVRPGLESRERDERRVGRRKLRRLRVFGRWRLRHLCAPAPIGLLPRHESLGHAGQTCAVRVPGERIGCLGHSATNAVDQAVAASSRASASQFSTVVEERAVARDVVAGLRRKEEQKRDV